MMFQTFYALLHFITFLHMASLVRGCPSICVCQDDNVDCSGKNLQELPSYLPKQTKHLDLSLNSFVEVPDVSRLQHLRVLTLARNYIQKINLTRMSNTGLIKVLDLSYNDITDISLFSLPFPQLEKLSLQHNNIKNLDIVRNSTMPKLKILRAGYNSIEQLVSPLDMNWDLTDFPSLQILELNNNKISAISMFLTRFKFLKKLVLSHNRLMSLDSSSFLRNSDLEELYLDHNQLSSVTNLWFTFKWKLRTLDLSHNLVHQFDQQAFDSARNVKYIDLSNNNLQSLDTGMFYQLQNLSYLNLHNNSIDYVSEHAFFGLHMLVYLNLSNNRISIGNKEFDTAFTPLHMLKILDLNSNKILLIPADAFLGLSSLQTLYIKFNKVKIIEKKAFIHLKNITALYLNTNDLLCDCSVGWLRNWIKKESLQNTITGICSSPRWLENKNFMNVLDTELVCGEGSMMYTHRPKVVAHPKSKYAFFRGNATLRCVATSSTNSPLIIQWYRSSTSVDYGKSEMSDQIQVGVYGYKRMARLTLKGLSFDDGGEYWCHVFNVYGSDWSATANLSIVVAPSLSPAISRDLIARSGEDVFIPCSAEGIPTPNIQFTKENTPLPFHAVVEKRIVYTDHHFVIQKLKIEDSGMYSCTAKSPVGVANATVRLTVIEEPKFIRPMKDKAVVAGSTAVVDCIVSGNPRPKITWYKDGTLLKSTIRVKLSSQLLVVPYFQYSDEGIYECRASNRLGTVRQKARLSIGTDAGYSSSKLPSDIFIVVIVVTVVAVVALTSLVWLALICYCRKKRRENARSDANLVSKHTKDSLSQLPKEYILRCNGLLVSAQTKDDIHALDAASESLLLDTRAYLRQQQGYLEDGDKRKNDDDEDDSGVALVFPTFGRNHESTGSRGLQNYENFAMKTSKPQATTAYVLHPNQLSSSNNSASEVNKHKRFRGKLKGVDTSRLISIKPFPRFPPPAMHEDNFRAYITSSSGIESGESSSSLETTSLTNNLTL